MKMTVFWDVATRSPIEIIRRFRHASRLYRQLDDGGREQLSNIGQLLRDYTEQCFYYLFL
jgi:hypothetical protein